VARKRRLRSANDEFQLALALLTNRRHRHRQRRFFVEGVRAIDQAVANAWPIESLWTSVGARLSGWATALVESDLAREHVEAEPELMAQLSGKEETSELLAIVEMPPDDLARIRIAADALVVVFDRPVSPGNLGSVIRSADALGAHGVVVTGHAADLYDPQTVRASTGTLFALPCVRAESLDASSCWLEPLHVVGSSAHGDVEPASVDLAGPTALVIGNETAGLSRSWREGCDVLVRIPMRGTADSLNAAAAASILLYEADRQRRARAADGAAA
jgi:tRNA G18 (ribose-2'-O)-methylase SpoU